MHNIPPLGWIALGLLAVFVIVLNLTLIKAFRNKKKTVPKNSSGAFHRLGETIRNPWQKEDDMLSELSRRATELRGKSESPQNFEDDSKKTS